MNQTAFIAIDGAVWLDRDQHIVAPDGTAVHFVLGNRTIEKTTPVDPYYDPSGALIIATPGCGPTPRQIGVFYFPGNTASDSPCGGGVALEAFVRSFPVGTPMTMTTSYNQKGWEVFKCAEDARSFDAAVRLLGGEYTGSLGPLTDDVDDPAYKSAYLLIGAVGVAQSKAPFEKYCLSESHELGCHDFNGASVQNATATLPACVARSVLV